MQSDYCPESTNIHQFSFTQRSTQTHARKHFTDSTPQQKENILQQAKTSDFVMYSEVRDCSRAVHVPPLSAFTVVYHVDVARLTVKRMV
jgi:hypothetical protein